MGNNVTEIGHSAFYSCRKLKSITIPQSVTRIGEWAFKSCSSMNSITIPGNVTSIGNDAFDSCAYGASVTFENYRNLTEVGDNAFGITNIVIDQDAKNYILSLNPKAFDRSSGGGSASSYSYIWEEQ